MDGTAMQQPGQSVSSSFPPLEQSDINQVGNLEEKKSKRRIWIIILLAIIVLGGLAAYFLYLSQP